MDLVDSLGPSMLRVARMYVRSRAVAEDVVQDAWIGVLKGIDRFEGRSSLRTWIFRIVTNIAKTRGQREGRSVPFASLAGDDLDAPSFDPSMFLASDDPSWPGHWSTLPTRLAHDPRGPAGRQPRPCRSRGRAIDALPPMQAEVIRLRDVRGWTSEEVRNALDVDRDQSAGVVASRARQGAACVGRVPGRVRRRREHDRHLVPGAGGVAHRLPRGHARTFARPPASSAHLADLRRVYERAGAVPPHDRGHGQRLTEDQVAAPERESIREAFRRWRAERPLSRDQRRWRPGRPGEPSPAAPARRSDRLGFLDRLIEQVGRLLRPQITLGGRRVLDLLVRLHDQLEDLVRFHGVSSSGEHLSRIVGSRHGWPVNIR